jgi:hypothetical protein
MPLWWQCNDIKLNQLTNNDTFININKPNTSYYNSKISLDSVNEDVEDSV